MANLWFQAENETWAARPLEPGEGFVIGAAGVVRATDPEGVSSRGPGLMRYADELTGRERWVLLVAKDAVVRVNGQAVVTGVRAIRDRDAIEVDGETLFFSTERLPVVVAFRETGARVVCRRCGLEIKPGTAAVRCPQCETWHHELGDRRCWTALPGCAVCEGATSGVEYAWTPGAL